MVIAFAPRKCARVKSGFPGWPRNRVDASRRATEYAHESTSRRARGLRCLKKRLQGRFGEITVAPVMLWHHRYGHQYGNLLGGIGLSVDHYR